jgi:hypothetical protein
MQPRIQNRYRLLLEQLEDRVVPAKVTFASGVLTIVGSPTGRLDVTATGSNAVTVTDNAGAVTYGNFSPVKSINLDLHTHPNIVNVNLNGNTLAASVFIDLGLGDPNVSGTHPVNIFGGTLSGSLTMQNGNGQENYSIGLAGNPATILGNVFVTGKHGPGGGNTLFVVDNSMVTGNLVVSKVDNVDIGTGTGTAAGIVSGNVSVVDSDSPDALSVNVLGAVNGNMSISGSNAGNIVTLIQSHGAGSGVVLGSLSANLETSPGLASDKFTMSANTLVGNNLTVTGAAGGEAVSLSGTVAGNATFNLGNGTNTITLGPTIGVLNQTFVIGGSVSTTMGNGTNTFDIKGSAASSIAGSVSTIMGNGTNTFLMDGAAQVLGSTVSYRGGTVSDTVRIINGQLNNFALNVTFFTGTRTVELGAGITLGSMRLDFGTGAGTKTLQYDGGLIVTWPSVILNFP